uniref:BTB domain-containing protein n=1 Tax=Sphaeramia orbicularis TaxID=375764 RepID=A0A672ZQD5_9TELE
MSLLLEEKMFQKATTSSLMAIHSDSHKHSILSKFDKLRKQDLLCDITLVVEDIHFKAHKALLAASSEYFSVIFTAQNQVGQSLYRLDDTAAEMFAAVLEFIYSAQVCVEESAKEQLLAVAHRMEVKDLRREYQKLLGLLYSVLLKIIGGLVIRPYNSGLVCPRFFSCSSC